MKVAIPTDDGLHISPRCEMAKGFVVAALENGKIINEELRWNPEADPDDPRTAPLSVIEDCKVVIVGSRWHECLHPQKVSEKEIIVVRDDIITNVLLDYIEMTLLRESNTCCSP